MISASSDPVLATSANTLKVLATLPPEARPSVELAGNMEWQSNTARALFLNVKPNGNIGIWAPISSNYWCGSLVFPVG